jgi:transcriptional regulator with XRE-family HTH domain
MNVGEKIKECRDARGWSQQQLADKLNAPGRKSGRERLSRASVALWETGKTHPRHNIIVQLAEIFEKPASYFQRGGTDTMPPAAEGSAARELHALLSDWRGKHDLRPSEMVRLLGEAIEHFGPKPSK